jgi:4-amino-4-deoxy-L-arabinose transferase-like glycosyltransferase
LCVKKQDLSLTFGLFTALLFVTAYGYTIFTDGMFFDGVFYAAIANNLANGIGTFWEMQYTTTLHATFHEQPPLALFLQSLFFRLFGDSIYVERLYCFVSALLMIWLIIRTWMEVAGKENKYNWLPVLLWLSIPLNLWTYQNNLIELTLGVLDLAAIFFILKGCRQNSFTWLLLGGLFTFLAFFSKGLQGLFPIVAPIVYWLAYRSQSFSKSCMQAMVVTAVPVTMIGLLYLYPPARQFFDSYIERRLGGTFDHLQDTTKSHFYLLYKLGLELLAPIGVGLIFWALSRKQAVSVRPDMKAVLFFTGIGLTASLPLMVTLEQRPFYLATSFPYFVLAIGLLALPSVDAVLEKIKNKKFNVLNYALTGLIIVALAFVALSAKNPKRDHALISDLSLIRKEIPHRTTISIPPEMETKWNLHAYFMRYCHLSLDDQQQHTYFVRLAEDSLPQDTCYKTINLPLNKFVLYKCR